MAYRITLIPGDGTGPELVEATRPCLAEITHRIPPLGCDRSDREAALIITGGGSRGPAGRGMLPEMLGEKLPVFRKYLQE